MWMEQTPRVDLDLGGLRMIAEALRADVELGLKPGASRAEREIQHGIRFGSAAPGGQLAAARDVFAVALERAHENITRQVRGAQILTAALEAVLANYAQADQVAAGRMADVQRTLSEAISAAEAVTQPPPPAGGDQP